MRQETTLESYHSNNGFIFGHSDGDENINLPDTWPMQKR